MKKLILISLLTLGSSLFAADIGIRIQTPIGNNTTLDIGFKSDDHRYDNRYRNFDYPRYGYYDDFGYYFGFFDRFGYFYNNIYFTYDSRYSYYDRLNHRGYFKPNKGHFRTYRYHSNNDWNRSRNYREVNKPIYGAYYDRNYNNKRIIEIHHHNKNEKNYRNNSNQHNQKNYKDQNGRQNHKDYRNNNNNQHNQRNNKEKSSNQNQRNDKNNKEKFIEEKRNNR